MKGVTGYFLRFMWWVCVLIVVCVPAVAGAECPSGNLLERAEIVGSRGVQQAERLTDGWFTPEGTLNAPRETVVFQGTKAEVIWELEGVMPIAAIELQAAHDGSFELAISEDGRQFRKLWDVPHTPERGLQTRTIHNLREQARFVRFRGRGAPATGVVELRAFCTVPSPFPPPRLVRLSRVERRESTLTYNAYSGKIVVALLGLFLVFVVAPRLGRRWRDRVLLFVVAMSALGWTHFGQFQGKTMIHPWDMFHYYTGSKYYDELGYFDLYRCIAKWDAQEDNLDRYEGLVIRDLDDNVLYPFSWTQTEAGKCRAQFSEQRWKEFGADLEAFKKRMDSPPFEHVIGDHGFNATPFHATWLGAVTKFTHPTGRTLRVLAQIDSMALLAAVFALAWGFGLPVAAVAALLIQVGAPWSYNWVGGGLGRHVWFALSCWGLALLKQKYPGRGTAALTAAAMLRLFPLVLLGGLGAYYILEWIRERQLPQQARSALAGFGLTLGIGLAVVAVSHGVKPFGDFVDAAAEHADSPSGNRLGLPHLLSLGPGKTSDALMDNRLTDPTGPWKDTIHITRNERRPLWYLAVLASLGVLGWVVWRLRSPWISVLAAGPLLYSLQEMTSYDYMWLVLLVPGAFHRRRALWWLCGFAIFTQVISIAIPSVETRHWIYSLALFPTVVVLALEFLQWGKPETEARVKGSDTKA